MTHEIPEQSIAKFLAAAVFFMIAGGYIGMWYHHRNPFDVQVVPIVVFVVWAGGSAVAFGVSALNGITEAREA